MKKHYFLGMAANYKGRLWAHTFAVGREQDRALLKKYLAKKYDGEAILTKNGRSALALALKAYFEPGDAVIVNGFTCYAVYEAVRAARLIPIWADINREDLNFNAETLNDLISDSSRLARPGPFAFGNSRPKGRALRADLRSHRSSLVADGLEPSGNHAQIRGIIVQNSLGNPVDIVTIEKLAKKHNLTIIEDLAHCAGVKYADGREAGTVGAAAALSFGKEKSIDTISGGAVVLRRPYRNTIEAPNKVPHLSDNLRARFYPLIGAISRGLTYVHLGGVFMRGMVKTHWVEKSADNKLDLTRKIAKFEAKLALKQFGELKKSGEPPLREFVLVSNRDKLLKELAKNGYYFNGFWYEKPVSPERYYKKVHFPEKECPVATELANKIINLPTYYSKKSLEPARKIIAKYEEKQK